MNPGFVLISYGKVTDTKPTALKEEFRTYSSQVGHATPCRATWGSTSVIRSRRERRAQPEPLLCFQWEGGRVRKFEQVQDWIV